MCRGAQELLDGCSAATDLKEVYGRIEEADRPPAFWGPVMKKLKRRRMNPAGGVDTEFAAVAGVF